MESAKKDSNIKDNNQNQPPKDKAVDLNLVLLKTHKLSSVLYLVTNPLADQDPLKWRLRDLALQAVADISDLVASRSESRQIGIIETVVATFNRVISFIDIAVQNRSVSEMNLTILKQEYLQLRSKMESFRQQIQPALFAAPVQPPEWLAVPAAANPAPALTAQYNNRPLSEVVSVKDKGRKTEDQDKSLNNSRREAIVAFVKKHDWSSIKDIARAVPGVSSKTVQRELADLVRQGTLKKEGDRRWSRYAAL